MKMSQDGVEEPKTQTFTLKSSFILTPSLFLLTQSRNRFKCTCKYLEKQRIVWFTLSWRFDASVSLYQVKFSSDCFFVWLAGIILTSCSLMFSAVSLLTLFGLFVKAKFTNFSSFLWNYFSMEWLFLFSGAETTIKIKINYTVYILSRKFIQNTVLAKICKAELYKVA